MKRAANSVAGELLGAFSAIGIARAACVGLEIVGVESPGAWMFVSVLAVALVGYFVVAPFLVAAVERSAVRRHVAAHPENVQPTDDFTRAAVAYARADVLGWEERQLENAVRDATDRESACAAWKALEDFRALHGSEDVMENVRLRDKFRAELARQTSGSEVAA